MSHPPSPEPRPVRVVPPDADPDADPLYNPAERAIFRYRLFAGGAEWAGDPLGIEARYDVALPDDEKAIVGHWLRRKNATVNIKALARLAPAALAAFGLPPLDPRTGEGATVDEVLGLLDRFHGFRERTAARHRRAAEMASVFPATAPARPGYLTFCGLYWNRERCQGHAAAAVYRGVLAATLRGPMDPADLLALPPGSNGQALLAELVARLAYDALRRARGRAEDDRPETALARETLAALARGEAVLPFLEAAAAGLPATAAYSPADLCALDRPSDQARRLFGRRGARGGAGHWF